ncbi:hypothetical protein JOC76_000028 [Neobacillus cucumis]|nr:hypothetical protein [Neobacillus cucumis]
MRGLFGQEEPEKAKACPNVSEIRTGRGRNALEESE